MYNNIGATENLEMVGVIAVLVMILVYLIIMGLGIATYIINSLAIYRLADRRQIPNPWMAWLPFASDWIIGSIVDQYDEKNGIKRKWRVLLLTLSLISIIGIIVVCVGMIVGMLVMAIQETNMEPEVGPTLAFIGVLYIVLLIFAMLASAKGFCQAICIYKIYESTVPEKAVKYLLLYLLVPLAGPLCLLKCQDKGYPYLQEQEVVVCETPVISEEADTVEETSITEETEDTEVE